MLQATGRGLAERRERGTGEFQFPSREGQQVIVLGREVTEQGPSGDACGLGQLVDRHIAETPRREEGEGNPFIFVEQGPSTALPSGGL